MLAGYLTPPVDFVTDFVTDGRTDGRTDGQTDELKVFWAFYSILRPRTANGSVFATQSVAFGLDFVHLLIKLKNGNT